MTPHRGIREEPRSAFAKRLAANPELAARFEAVVSQLRRAVDEDIEAGRRGERIGPNDLGIIINARTDHY